MHLKFLPILSIAVLTISSCQPENKNQNATPQPQMTSVADSITWNGLYKGITPCADCEGIETILVLNTDTTYLLRTQYLGKADPMLRELTGKFTWNADASSILLAGIENAPNQYLVGEKQLTQLDLKGQKITGKSAVKYVLIKK